MKRCFKCGRGLDPAVRNGYGVFKCRNCGLYYVRAECLDGFLRAELSRDARYGKYGKYAGSGVAGMRDSYRLLSASKCRGCAANCACERYRYRGLEFSHCMQEDLYAFTLEELKRFADRRFRGAWFRRIIEIVKGLFRKNVEE